MIYIGLGLLMHHLHAHPSQTQMPFSMRKGNPSKRSFPYNNLGYGNNITIPLAVCQKPNQMFSTADFLDINNSNCTYTLCHYPFFCCAHPGMPQICHRTDGGLGTPCPVSAKSLSAPKGLEVLVVWYSILFELGKLP